MTTKLSFPAQRALLRAANRPDKAVESHNGEALMNLNLAGFADRGALTAAGEMYAAQLRTQEHDTDPIDARFAALAPGHPARTAA